MPFPKHRVTVAIEVPETVEQRALERVASDDAPQNFRAYVYEMLDLDVRLHLSDEQEPCPPPT